MMMMTIIIIIIIIITDRTSHNSRPDRVVLDKTIKEWYPVGAAIPDSLNFHSTITEKLQKYRDLKEELIRMWQLKTAHMMSLVPSKMGMFPNKLYESIELLNLRPGIYIIMQKAVILNTCRIIRMFLTEQPIRSAWSVRTVLF